MFDAERAHPIDRGTSDAIPLRLEHLMAYAVGRWAQLFPLHQRLLAADPSAPGNMAREVLEPLLTHLQRRFPTTDEDVIGEGVVAAFLEYAEDPAQCPADDGDGVFRFLVMVGWRRVRDTLRAEHRRARWEGAYAAERHPVPGPPGESSVEVPDPLARLLQEEEAAAAAETVGTHQRRVMNVLDNEQDRRIQEMRFSGERRTTAFAAVLGIARLPRTEQQRLVKQHKDRIDKAIERALGPGSARLSAPGTRRRRGQPGHADSH